MNGANRERLVHAVVHFASATADCKVKRLFVALYLLDVAHFQRTGRTVTGLDYFAGEYGPYPHALAHEFDGFLRPDLAKLISIVHVPGLGRNDEVHPLNNSTPLEELYSSRERALFQDVIARLEAADAAGAVRPLRSAVMSADNGAWERALRVKKHSPIAMEDTVAQDAPNRAAVLEQAIHYRARAERLRLLAA